MQRHGRGRSPRADAEERLLRALHENAQLKSEKNELEEKLKKVQTQFRRLAADWRQVQEGGHPPLQSSTSLATAPSARPASAGAAHTPARSVLPSLPPNQRGGASRTSSLAATPLKRPSLSALPSVSETNRSPAAAAAVSEAEFAACKAALAHAQLEVQQMRATMASASAATTSSTTTAAAAAAAAAAQQEAATLRGQLQQVREELNQSLLAQQQLQSQTAQSMAGLQRELQGGNATQQQLEAQYRASLDALTREKQELALRLRLMEVEKQSLESAAAAASATGSPEAADLATLHGELHRKASEVTLLNSRLQYAQGQVETLKGECGRLVDELRQAATAHGDTKKALFALEHEAAALRAKSVTLSEVETALQRKNEENVHLEEELLKLVGSLQSCNRETEAAVRLEFQSRLSEVQEMRDTAERDRREAERRLLNCQHDVAELRRALESAQEDAQMYRGQAAKVEKERSVLSAQMASAGRASAAVSAAGAELTDDEVHRALAVAAMRKRGGAAGLSRLDAVLGAKGGSQESAAEARGALDLYEALSWDGDWELGQLREALATAAMDLELAETRCQQMQEEVAQCRSSLAKMSAERDTLLEESIALRGRVTHVQTIFAKQQLQAYRSAAAAGRGNDGLIAFSIRGLRSRESAMCRALGVADTHGAVAFFFTLDGLEEYETMISPTLYAMDDVVDVRLQYEGLAKDAVTLATIERTTFTFQLHCTDGDGSRLVAMAELPGMALLAARELSMEESLSLIDGTGETIGTMVVEFCCSHLMLPVLLDAPLASHPQAGGLTLSAAEVKAAMVALRAVRHLRIQVFAASGLAGSAEAGTLPQPYVFYTASSPLGGLSCVRDTVVRPCNKSITADPVFDAAPTDHRVIVDAALIRFIAYGTVTFVVFDERATEIQVNLGVVEVALRPLLESPVALLRTTGQLHPQGTLTVGLSWVSGA